MLNAGSVSIANDGTASGTGLARELYDGRIAALIAVTVAGWASIGTTQQLVDKRYVAAGANSDATVIVAHITANAVASVVVSAGGLQNTPNPNTAATATAAPAAPVTLTGAVT